MPFSPSDISGLKIWLKADAGAGSSDGDPVGTWSDQSGGSHNFTAAGSARPTYKVNIRLGLPAVLFDGSDDEMDGGNLSSLFSTGASVFAAAEQISGSSWTLYEHGQIDAWWSFSGAGYWGPFRSARLSGTPGSGLPTSGWHYWSMTADNGSNYKMWVDGSSQINDSAGFTFQGGTQHRIGRQHPNGNYMNMHMGEIIIYDSALGTTDRGSVETYLHDRWISNPNATVAATLATGTADGIVPTILYGYTTSATLAAATADAITPAAVGAGVGIAAPMATATAAANAPSILTAFTVAATMATATAAANIPTLLPVVVGVLATATASALTPSLLVSRTVLSVLAAAAASIDQEVVVLINGYPGGSGYVPGVGGAGGTSQGLGDFWTIEGA